MSPWRCASSSTRLTTTSSSPKERAAVSPFCLLHLCRNSFGVVQSLLIHTSCARDAPVVPPSYPQRYPLRLQLNVGAAKGLYCRILPCIRLQCCSCTGIYYCIQILLHTIHSTQFRRGQQAIPPCIPTPVFQGANPVHLKRWIPLRCGSGQRVGSEQVIHGIPFQYSAPPRHSKDSADFCWPISDPLYSPMSFSALFS